MLSIERLRANLNKSNKITGDEDTSSSAGSLNKATERAAEKIDSGLTGETLERPPGDGITLSARR